MNFDPNYVLSEVDQRRIKPLLDDIFDSTIKFTYLITMTYPYRITDYTEVMKHNRHKLYVLKKNLNQSIKSFTTIEKHTSPHNIRDPHDPEFYTKTFYKEDDEGKTRLVSRYGSLHTHTLIDAENTSMNRIRSLIRTHCSKEYNSAFGGFNIKRVNDKVSILSYMTKDISLPYLKDLNLDRRMVIDTANSSIGRNHPSIRGSYEVSRQNRISERVDRKLSYASSEYR